MEHTACVVEEVFEQRDLETVSGSKFCMDNVSGVNEICGDIGDVKPPCYYIAKGDPRRRMFLMLMDGKVCGYCATKFAEATASSLASAIIDVLGIHPIKRKNGLASIFYGRVKRHLLSPGWIDALRAMSALKPREEFTISLQAVYDYESYKALLAKHSTQSLHRTEKNVTKHKITVDMAAIAQRLEGPCSFWRMMGFTERRLYVLDSVINPVLVMWFKPNIQIM